MQRRNNSSWKQLTTKIVYTNPWIKIHEDTVLRPDGKDGLYAFMEKNAGVYVIALDSEGYYYLIEEFRYPINKKVLQLPGGTLESENADILETSKRELQEETGIVANKLFHLGGYYVSPGHETTVCNVIYATDLNVSNLKINQDGDEDIQNIVKVDLKELRTLLSNGSIEDALTHTACNVYFNSKYFKKN